MNRTLQRLRRDQLIEMSGSNVVLLDLAQLTVMADYQASRLAQNS